MPSLRRLRAPFLPVSLSLLAGLPASGCVAPSADGAEESDGSTSGPEPDDGTSGGPADEPELDSDGDSEGCSSACPEPEPEAVCGNGRLEADETCDQGGDNDDGDLCKSDCTLQVCGDGHVGPGEACDDGNADEDDGCSSDCAPPQCGDGVVQGVEQCDDGNDDDRDACRSNCALAVCGDAVVQAEVERCDDGNADDADGCSSACEATPRCGDGEALAGELCFGAPIELAGGGELADLVVGELTLDGHLDVATLTSDGRLRMFVGDGGGGFAQEPDQAFGAGRAHALGTGDFDGDERSDLVLGDLGRKQTSLRFHGDGPSGFERKEDLQLATGPLRVETADMNGDGIDEVAQLLAWNTEFGRQCAQWVTASEDDPALSYGHCFPRAGIADLAVGAFTGGYKGFDAHIALAMNDPAEVAVAIPYVEPSAEVGTAPGYRLKLVPVSLPEDVVVVAMASGRIDADEHDDLAVVVRGPDCVDPADPGSCEGDELIVVLGGAVEPFLTVKDARTRVGHDVRSLAIADFDGDGTADVVVGNRRDATVGILIGDGAGTLAEPTVVSTGLASVDDLAVGDLDEDGHADVVVMSSNTNLVAALLSDP